MPVVSPTELAARDATTVCMACGGALTASSVRVEDCHHVLCIKCARNSLGLNPACPMPGCVAICRAEARFALCMHAHAYMFVDS
jgi:hypothetical protein